MTDLLPEAIEAAAAFLPGIPTDNRERQLRETTMRAALTAAAPYIEKAVRADERARLVALLLDKSDQAGEAIWAENPAATAHLSQSLRIAAEWIKETQP